MHFRLAISRRIQVIGTPFDEGGSVLVRGSRDAACGQVIKNQVCATVCDLLDDALAHVVSELVRVGLTLRVSDAAGRMTPAARQRQNKPDRAEGKPARR